MLYDIASARIYYVEREAEWCGVAGKILISNYICMEPKTHNSLTPQDVLGKCILVGFTYIKPDGTIREQTQKHGRISQCDENDFVFVDEDTQEELSLPPNLDWLDKADPEATYTLKSSGKEISGVDFVTSISVQEPS